MAAYLTKGERQIEISSKRHTVSFYEAASKKRVRKPEQRSSRKKRKKRRKPQATKPHKTNTGTTGGAEAAKL